MKIFAFIVNPLKDNKIIRNLAKNIFGISNAYFPNIVSEKLINSIPNSSTNKIYLLADSFNYTFEPENLNKTIELFSKLGYSIEILPFNHTGRTFISKGFLKQAKKHAFKLISFLKEVDPKGIIPIIGIEPSEVITLRDEYQDFFPNDEYVKSLFSRSFLFDEFIIRKDLVNHLKQNKNENVTIHGHCYQKSAQRLKDAYPVGVKATISLLEDLGYVTEEIPSGCCGMAGSFGYEERNYDLSMRVGESILFPAVRKTNTIVVAPGISCRGHIQDGTGKKAIHPIQLLEIKKD